MISYAWKRTWSERLLSWPWRPWHNWVEVVVFVVGGVISKRERTLEVLLTYRRKNEEEEL